MSEAAKKRDYSNIDLDRFNKAGIESSKKPVKQIKSDGEVFVFESITDALKQFKTKQSRHLKNAILTGKTYKKSNWFFIQKT